MSDTVMIALFSLIGSLVGTLGGILTASSLTNYRIKQLEKKVDKHNNFAERIPTIESNIGVLSRIVEKLENFHLKQ